jgi:hypothetical protein
MPKDFQCDTPKGSQLLPRQKMSSHPVVDDATWLRARIELLEKEKELKKRQVVRAVGLCAKIC